jgi:predicted nucleic acid-binding protein
VIVADTGAIIALIDTDDQHHEALRAAFAGNSDRWVLPWAILPEVDYLLGEHVGHESEALFLQDLATGAWQIEWGDRSDLVRAHEIASRHPSLRLGLVDAVVIAVAERLEAEAIATLDLRDFAAIDIKGAPRLLPRDL